MRIESIIQMQREEDGKKTARGKGFLEDAFVAANGISSGDVSNSIHLLDTSQPTMLTRFEAGVDSVLQGDIPRTLSLKFGSAPKKHSR